MWQQVCSLWEQQAKWQSGTEATGDRDEPNPKPADVAVLGQEIK